MLAMTIPKAVFQEIFVLELKERKI